MTTYLLAGGGTAGHVNPLLAVADRLRLRHPDATILVLGTAEGLEARLVPARGYELLTIAKLPFPRRPNRAAIRFPRALVGVVTTVDGYLRERSVDVVVGFGGYAAAPAYLAARKLGIPFVIHEANAKPGMANKLGALLTPFVGVAFSVTRLPGAEVVGMPLRREIETLVKHEARAEAREYFNLDPDKPTLLVTGGSTGARSINATVAASVPLLLGTGWQIVHIVGDRAEVDDPKLAGYHYLRYCDRMELALAAADLAVSRAGSATVSELTALGIPAVYVPYPVGNGEQRFNALDVVNDGGALLIDDARFTPEWVSSTLVPLMLDRARVAALAARTGRRGSVNGADRAVDLIERAVATATMRHDD